MARTAQVARCSHSGPQCQKCVRADLLSRARAQLNLQPDLIDAQVAASVLANGGNVRAFGRRTLAILPEVHALTARVYPKFLARAKSVASTNLADAKVSAKRAAIKFVAGKLDAIFRRHDHNKEIANKPANLQRAKRWRRRSEVRDAIHNRRAVSN